MRDDAEAVPLKDGPSDWQPGELDHLMRSWPWWVIPWGYMVVELLCLLLADNSLVAVATASVYGDVQRSLVTRVHIGSAMAMWFLGGVQMCAKSMRKHFPAAHRATGIAFLLTWSLLVGPTAFYLSLVVRGDSVFGTLASITLLDVTFLCYYFFFCAWRVARKREQGAFSLQLHGNLMGLGAIGTMIQIPQRLIQFVLIGVCKAVHLALRGCVPAFAARAFVSVFSQEFIFGLSMVFGNGFILTLVDGPRTQFLKDRVGPATGPKSMIRRVVYGTCDRDEVEMWSYDVTDWRVRWRWRSRLAVFALARGMVTHGWTEQPQPLNVGGG